VHTDKLGLLADTILASGADLVALQEVSGPEAVAMLVALMNLKAACSEEPLPARKQRPPQAAQAQVEGEKKKKQGGQAAATAA
jgi:hypothetical protein